MSIVEGRTPSGLVERARALLQQPTATWKVIDEESATIGGLFTGYVMILAAIPPIAQLIHGLLFGYGAFGVHWRPSPLWLITSAITQYVMSLVSVAILGLVIEALAKSFDGAADRLKAFKLAAYTGTAMWLAGAFAALPFVGFLALAGLYSFYLLWVGLPILMKSPQEKTAPYFVVVLIVALVVNVVAFAIGGAITGMGHGGYADASHVSGKVSIPGLGSVDLDKAQAAAERAEAASKAIQDGKDIKVVSADALQGVLPADVAGYARGEVSTSSTGVNGYNASSAEATYTRGEASFHLRVADMGAAGLMAGMAGAMNVEHTEQHGASYEKVGKVDGRMVMEKVDADAKHAEYTVLAGDHMVIEAEGDNVSIDDLKAAVAAVDPARVEGLKP